MQHAKKPKETTAKMYILGISEVKGVFINGDSIVLLLGALIPQ